VQARLSKTPKQKHVPCDCPLSQVQGHHGKVAGISECDPPMLLWAVSGPAWPASGRAGPHWARERHTCPPTSLHATHEFPCGSGSAPLQVQEFPSGSPERARLVTWRQGDYVMGSRQLFLDFLRRRCPAALSALLYSVKGHPH